MPALPPRPAGNLSHAGNSHDSPAPTPKTETAPIQEKHVAETPKEKPIPRRKGAPRRTPAKNATPVTVEKLNRTSDALARVEVLEAKITQLEEDMVKMYHFKEESEQTISNMQSLIGSL